MNELTNKKKKTKNKEEERIVKELKEAMPTNKKKNDKHTCGYKLARNTYLLLSLNKSSVVTRTIMLRPERTEKRTTQLTTSTTH